MTASLSGRLSYQMYIVDVLLRRFYMTLCCSRRLDRQSKLSAPVRAFDRELVGLQVRAAASVSLHPIHEHWQMLLMMMVALAIMTVDSIRRVQPQVSPQKKACVTAAP